MLAMEVGIRQVHSENASPTFSDDFNGTSIDPTKWNVTQNIETSGYPAYGGNVTVADSFVTLTSYGTSYPCIPRAQDPFPTTGDFALEFDITYTRLETWGTGLWVSEGPFVPTNATNVAANILQVWSYFNGLTGVVSIGLLGKAVYTWNANLNPYGDQFSNPMLIRLEYAQGTYTLYLNGTVLSLRRINPQSRHNRIRTSTSHNSALFFTRSMGHIQNRLNRSTTCKRSYYSIKPTSGKRRIQR